MYKYVGKLGGGGCCTSSSPYGMGKGVCQPVPIVKMRLNDKEVKGLFDTGCSNTIVRAGLVEGLAGVNRVCTFSGQTIDCEGSVMAEVEIDGVKIKLKVIGAEHLLGGVDVILGMDVICKLGTVTITNGNVTFDSTTRCMVGVPNAIEVGVIDDRDFSGKFDGAKWTVEWKWKPGTYPILKNMKERYDSRLSAENEKLFEDEVERWIREGILVPYRGKVEGVLPLMAVLQETKKKVRPVLDFRELNSYVQCHTGDEEINVCSEKLREWRKTNGELELVDLQSAYLQIRVEKSLWKYQVVKFKGNTYCLTRLGFGLNVAPRIMAVVLKRVLSLDDEVREATNPYVDDILVNTSRVTSQKVIHHLERFGLKSKPPEKLDGGAALGLKLHKLRDGTMEFTRGNEVPEIPDALSRRGLFSICGKMVGHYPVAGWLRVACSYIKREATGVSWDDDAGRRSKALIREVRERVRTEDPVKGAWSVKEGNTGTVWCDASGLALGVILEIGGVVVEDRAWLRKSNDFNHINVAELESVVKGLNLAVDWGITELIVKTDSSTVRSWVQLTLSGDHPVRTKGAAEVLIKRRLGILRSLIEELGIRVSIELVPSRVNKADALTRVPKAWLAEDSVLCSAGIIEDLHRRHHMGVDRTLYLAKRLDPSSKESQVRNVVRGCEECQSIDPAPAKHEAGSLEVDKTWTRLAVDVTHYRGVAYLSMVDCGPGRFALWRRLKRETAQCICNQLRQIFLERGPVEEVLMDNGSFRSSELRQLFSQWKIWPFYRGAHRPTGNAIVERHHRTIKRWAEKAAIDPEEAVFWYNVSPRVRQEASSVPQTAVHAYTWRLPVEEPEMKDRGVPDSIEVGDQVWVRPGGARCTTKWSKGQVTDINSSNNVSVDGMPRHILDIRPVVHPQDRDSGESEEEQVDEPSLPRRSGRIRHQPGWMADYVTD